MMPEPVEGASPPMDVDALGHVVRVRFESSTPQAWVARTRQAWADAAVTESHPGEPVELGDPFVTMGEDHGLQALSSRVTLAAIEANATRLWMLHAAGVADPRGRVIAFAGPSGAGKTTLSQALGRRYAYVTDETVGVGEGRRVLAYRKPLSVVQPSGPKMQVSPSALGLLGLPEGDLTLAAVVVLARDRTATMPLVEEMGWVEALAALIPQSSYLSRRERPLQRMVEDLAAVGGAVRITYAEAGTVADVVAGLFDRKPRSQEAVAWHEVLDGGVLNGTIVDALRVGPQVGVLTSTQFVVLDGIAPSVVEAYARDARLEAITDSIVQEFGPPPEGDPQAMVRDALNALNDVDVLPSRF